MDTYVRTEQFVTLKTLRERGFHRAVGLDEGNEDWPGIYPRLRAFSVPGNVSRATPMPQLQALFESSENFTRAMWRRDVLNTGGGWLELGLRESTLSFLDRFFAYGDAYQRGKDGRGKYLRCFPYEQRVLNALMSLPESAADRRQTALLEEAVYNSPRSPCIVHLYSNNKRNGAYRRTLEEVLQRRLAKSQAPPRSLNAWVIRAVGNYYDTS
jgi:hypothetical protein